jgi:predicted Zn-dependent peptidase
MIKNLTPASISAAARKYFDVNNYARFVLLPENKTTP